MNIRIFIDDTLSIDLDKLISGLKKSAPSINWNSGTTPFCGQDKFISSPSVYYSLPKELRNEINGDDRAFLFTEKPYDNNNFFDSYDLKVTIVSLFRWDHLTNLPRCNGLVFFVAALLVRHLKIGKSHKLHNTGCINDFWQDKTGVDSGMRSAYLCPSCATTKLSENNSKLKIQVDALLNDISTASRSNMDILDFWSNIIHPTAESFNVFLCHNSKDKPAVRQLNMVLKANGISTWLDEEQLPPGRAWQEILETQIQSIGAVAVIVGGSKFGPWQDVEMRAFISEFVRRRCPVIPVILEDCASVPSLPLFMQQFTWVDFRKSDPSPVDMLLWGITGNKPNKA